LQGIAMVLSDMFHVGAQGGSGEGSVVGGIPLITLVAAAARTAKSTIVGAAGCTMLWAREREQRDGAGRPACGGCYAACHTGLIWAISALNLLLQLQAQNPWSSRNEKS
jgi:hypothetical protein